MVMYPSDLKPGDLFTTLARIVASLGFWFEFTAINANIFDDKDTFEHLKTPMMFLSQKRDSKNNSYYRVLCFHPSYGYVVTWYHFNIDGMIDNMYKIDKLSYDDRSETVI